MQVKVSEPSMFERTLEVTVDADQVEGAYKKAFSRAVSRLALPGFRKGKVPAPMAKKYIGDENLGSDVVEMVVPTAYTVALKENRLNPISQPRWELVQRERGKELVFKVSFEVRPQIEVQDYKQVALKNEKHEITDEVVNQAVDEIRGRRSSLEDITEARPLQANDMALVDYQSTLDGEVVEGGAATNYLMEFKPEHFIPGFVDKLVGLEQGQERDFDITFPPEYPNEKLAGKEVHFHFKLNQIKERKLPELNEEFVKSVTPHTTVDAFVADVREQLETNTERRLREQVAVKIIDKLLPQVSNEMVPRSLHQYRTNVELRRRLQQFQQAGLSPERYLQDRNVTQQQWMNELQVMGMLEARVEILLESIAEKENLEPSDEEIEELITVEARNRGVSVQQLRQALEAEGGQTMIRYALLRAKVMDFLFDNANVEYVAPGELTEEAAAEAAPAEEGAKKPAKGKKVKGAEDAPAGEEASAAGEESKPKGKKAKAAPAEEGAAAPTEEGGEEGKPKAKRARKKSDAEE